MSKRDTFNKRLLDAIKKGGNVKSLPASAVRKASDVQPYESDIQQACIRWFKRHYPQLSEEGMLFHIANEGIRLGGMGARTKREGVVKGVADLCLSVPMHGYGASWLLPATRAEDMAVQCREIRQQVCRMQVCRRL